MKTVTLALNALDPSEWTTHEVEDIRAFLVERFDEWPVTARIYHKQVAEVCDVTPTCEADVERLGELDGPFHVVVYPEGPVAIFFAFAALAVVAVVALAFMAIPQDVPTPAARNTQSKSPNNELSARTNRARPNGRIPEIFGTVRSTPDLVAATYSVFESNREVEFALMCIGRGSYDISDVRDGDTPLDEVRGARVAFYEPGTSPNSGTPQLSIGGTINDPVLTVVRSASVNGQTLHPPSDPIAHTGMTVRGPNYIYAAFLTGDKGSFTADNFDDIQVGDSITLTSAVFSGNDTGGTPRSCTLTGTYQVIEKDDTGFVPWIRVDDPTTIDADWGDVNTWWPNGHVSGAKGTNTSGTMTGPDTDWIGPFFLDVPLMEKVFVNVVAPNGMFKDDGEDQYQTAVSYELELTPVDASGTPTGSAETFDGIVVGSAVTRDQRATTLRAEPTFTGRCKARMRRVTAEDTAFTGTVVDEVKWRDLYAVSPVDVLDFGDVTLAHSVTVATEGALAVKERKLNCLVTRLLPQRVSGSTFTSELYPTNNAADIISAICLDPYLGNRPASQVDFDSIYDTIAEVETYFDTPLATEFSYTFDSENLSFEETVRIVAEAAFCTAYRRGSVIKLFFEKETADSVLLLNHRNKTPGSETRTVSFGVQNDHDGVAMTYIDPVDDAVVTYYIPEDMSAVNPKKTDSLGIRSRLQAHFHAWRTWNKLRYQNTLVEFTATQEADILLRGERVLVADNTRPDTQDGQVESQASLELTLSQPVDFTGGGKSIFLQHYDGTVQSISITAGGAANKVVLAGAPTLPLSLDDENYAKATYMVVGSGDARSAAFLVTEKEPASDFTVKMQAVNYDDRYYANDQDFADGVVDEDGFII
jgi:hypothetical protein